MLPYNPKLKERSRQLRNNMTDAEMRLWAKVRRKQIKDCWFYRQKPVGEYIVDFYCPKAKLVIEVDGGQHFSDETAEYDRIRDEFLSNLGLRVLRFSNNDVMKNIEGVVARIENEISGQIPLSPPLRKGETAPSPFIKGRARGI